MVRPIANRSANIGHPAPPGPLTDALALQPYNAMISGHDDSNCLLLHFFRFNFRDCDFIGTRNSVRFCDIDSFFLTGAAQRSTLQESEGAVDWPGGDGWSRL